MVIFFSIIFYPNIFSSRKFKKNIFWKGVGEKDASTFSSNNDLMKKLTIEHLLVIITGKTSSMNLIKSCVSSRDVFYFVF